MYTVQYYDAAGVGEQMACQRGNPTSCTHIDWHARLVCRGQAQHKGRITRLVSIRALSVALQKDGVVNCCILERQMVTDLFSG